MSKKRIATGVVALSAVAGLLLSGCSSDDSSSGGSGASVDYTQAADYAPTDRDEVQDGGTLTLPLTEMAEQQNFFEANMNAYSRQIWTWYNPQLAEYSTNGEYSPNPNYITSVEDDVVDGHTVVSYTINEQATYNDGTPIDWRSFENTWRFSNGEMEGVTPNSTDGYELIDSVERGETDKQAVVTFTQAYPWWKGLFNSLLHPSVNTAELFNEGYVQQLHPEWGAGPFTVESVDFQRGEVIFVPNDQWWGDTPKLDRVTYRQMEDQASLNALRAGEIDATSVSTASRLKVAHELGDAVEIRTGREAAVNLLTLNSQTPALSDAAVREAIFRALDREQLAEVRFQGLDYEENAPGSLIFYEGQPGYEDIAGQIASYDPEQAKELLEEAGWSEGTDGIRTKDGETLTVRYTNFGDDEIFNALASATQQMLRQVGVDLQIDQRPTNQFSQVTRERDFDILPMAFSSSDPYGVAYFNQIYGSDSELNKSATGTEEFDKKILELQQLTTEDEQIAKSNELELEALQLYGVFPTMTRPAITAVKSGLVNYGPTFFGTIRKEDVGWKVTA